MNRTGAIVFALGLGLCAPLRAHAEEPNREDVRPVPPLPWQESMPTARMFLQLPFETPLVMGVGEWGGEVHLRYANSILVDKTPSLAVDVDLESAEILALFRYGLLTGVELQIAIPVAVDHGGFLDGAIESTERFFGATSMPHRWDRRRNEARFRIIRADGTGIWRDGAGAGLGDVWAAFKVWVRDQIGGWPMVALRAVIKIPTGRPPYGSGAADVGGSIILGWAWRRANLWIEVDAAFPTANLQVAHLSTHVYGATQLGLVVPLSNPVALNLQWSSHLSPFERTGIPQLDAPAHYFLLGVSIELSRSVLLEVAVVENIFSPASGVDTAMLFGLRINPERS